MILVIDSEEYRQEWFEKTFSDHKVRFAMNLNRAIDLMRNNSYDIIFIGHDTESEDMLDSKRVAFSIVELNLQPKAAIIIHSVYKESSDVIYNILKETHQVIKIPFGVLATEKYLLYGAEEL